MRSSLPAKNRTDIRQKGDQCQRNGNHAEWRFVGHDSSCMAKIKPYCVLPGGDYQRPTLSHEYKR
jgi:hypothetical protein